MQSNCGKQQPSTEHISSIEGFFNRKRGRPPKNRIVEVYKNKQHSPQAVFASFKIERKGKNIQVGSALTETVNETNVEDPQLFVLPEILNLTQNNKESKCTVSNNTCRQENNSDMRNDQISNAVFEEKRHTDCSVVKSKGIYFPENLFQTTDSMGLKNYHHLEKSPNLKEIDLELDTSTDVPEDLSLNKCKAELTLPSENPGVELNKYASDASLGLTQFIKFNRILAFFGQQRSQLSNMELLPTLSSTLSFAQMANTLSLSFPESTQPSITYNKQAFNSGTNYETKSANQHKQCDLLSLSKNRLDDTKESIPVGYLKFRFNEDCGFNKCTYRKHQSHFHCNRSHCHYSFCDKSRFVQHTARHERLEVLMGDDFQQFRASATCGYPDCIRSNSSTLSTKKNSHFHCLKCDFICTDTNKVVAHRRFHSKMDYVRSTGFRKVTGNEKCLLNGDIIFFNSTECIYSKKHTHYHCLLCNCSILSRAQLKKHYHKHAEEFQLAKPLDRTTKND